MLKFLLAPGMKTIPQGAATTVYVAIRPELEGVGGKYFTNCHEKAPHVHAQSEENAKKLWEISEKFVGLSS